MSEPAQRGARYEDLLGLPDNLVGEIVASEIRTHPRSAPRHALAASPVGGELGGSFGRGRGGGPGGWWILDEPELHLGEDILVPDLTGWRRERMVKLLETPWFELPPDWVCEVPLARYGPHRPGTQTPSLRRRWRSALLARRCGCPAAGSLRQPRRPLAPARCVGGRRQRPRRALRGHRHGAGWPVGRLSMGAVK